MDGVDAFGFKTLCKLGVEVFCKKKKDEPDVSVSVSIDSPDIPDDDSPDDDSPDDDAPTDDSPDDDKSPDEARYLREVVRN